MHNDRFGTQDYEGNDVNIPADLRTVLFLPQGMYHKNIKQHRTSSFSIPLVAGSILNEERAPSSIDIPARFLKPAARPYLMDSHGGKRYGRSKTDFAFISVDLPS